MPINRRNVGSNLIRKTLLVSDEAVERASKMAKTLQVSQGSLIDSAIKHFTNLPEDEVIGLMLKYEQLTSEEAKYILKLAGEKGK